MQLYPGPWKKEYWMEAARTLKSVRALVFAAVLVGVEVILSLLAIPIGGNALQIHFTFLAISLSNLVCGPFVALVSGCAADLLSFFVYSMGSPFFPGYTLTAMLSAFIYALFFFRAQISVLRIVLCKLVINYGMNVLLGSVWRIILYGKGYLFYVSTSFVKNTILLPIEVLILFLLFSLLLKPLAHMGLIPPQPTQRIPITCFWQKSNKEAI